LTPNKICFVGLIIKLVNIMLQLNRLSFIIFSSQY